jgi:predicted Rossmann-fold nucleotide-binding protein
MEEEQIDVISYSGRKGDERPLTFNHRGFRIDVLEILDHRVEEGFGDKVRKRYFRVKGSDGNTHRIYFNENILKWYYAS